MLTHHLWVLPDFARFLSELLNILAWLTGAAHPV